MRLITSRAHFQSNQDKVISLLFIGVFVVAWLLLATFIWNKTVPQVFHGAVIKGFLPGTVTQWQVFKLSLFMAILNIPGAGLFSITIREGNNDWVNKYVNSIVAFAIRIVVAIITGILVFFFWRWVIPDVFAVAVN